MLRQRILTALVLLPLVIGIIFSPPAVFAAAVAAALLVGAWEWARMAGLAGAVVRAAYLLLAALVLAFLWWAWWRGADALLYGFLIGASGWWLGNGLWLAWLEHRAHLPPAHRLRDAGGGLLMVGAPYAALLVLHQGERLGPAWVLFLMLLLWTADTAAYFTGRALGRHRLALHISPGKTWEGVAGGLAGSALAGWLGAVWFGLAGSQRGWFIAVCLVTAAWSVVGDLYESRIKRTAGMKDSGRLLPGHGGLMDRIDSLTAAAPAFVTGLWFMGRVA